MRFSASHGWITNCLLGDNLGVGGGGYGAGVATAAASTLLHFFHNNTTELQSATHSKHTEL
jgi:hypothetical protein